MVLCVCCAYDRWPVYTELIPGLGDAAHDLSFSWRISPRTAVLRSAAMASGFRKRSFLYTGCFGGSVCNASDRIAHPRYRHSDASWGSTVDLCRFSNLIQIPLVVLISHFFSRKGNALRILWLLPIIVIQISSIAVCYVAQYHAADEYFPDYMVGLMAVLLLINILIVFYVEALRENELEKFKVKFNEQQYNLQMEYYQQLKERQEEVCSLRHDVKKYILAMQAVAEHGDTEELHKIAQAATDVFERSTNISAVGNPVVDALLNYYLRIAERNYIKVKLDVTIPEVLTISSLSLSIIIGNTFDNAIEACCDLPAEQRIIHLQLRKQYRSLFYRLENPYSDTVRSIRIGEYHGYGLKNINRIVQENHGDFYTKKKDGVFTVQVRLNCEN